MMKRSVFGAAAIAVVALLMASLVTISARQQSNAGAIDNDDIGGVVTSTKGPEAGVWVAGERAPMNSPRVKHLTQAVDGDVESPGPDDQIVIRRDRPRPVSAEPFPRTVRDHRHAAPVAGALVGDSGSG